MEGCRRPVACRIHAVVLAAPLLSGPSLLSLGAWSAVAIPLVANYVASALPPATMTRDMKLADFSAINDLSQVSGIARLSSPYLNSNNSGRWSETSGLSTASKRMTSISGVTRI